MLDSIFGSVSRVKILNLLLLSPDKRCQPEQLISDLGLSALAVRHELNNLVNFGLVIEESFIEEKEEKEKKIRGKRINNHRQKEKKIYRANTNFLLYPEIKALFTKAQILFSQKFVNGLQKICQAKFLALTGVFTNYPEAQTDILFVGTVRRPAFMELLKELENDLGREINFTILNEKEFLYREDIMDIFLYNILEGQSLILIDNIHKSNNNKQYQTE